LLSVAARHLATIRFPSLEPPTPLFTVQRDRPYIVTETRLTLTNGKMTRLIFGRAANTPFGLISNDDKRALGRVIRGEVKGG